jgi:Flp pilus assembly protein TadD
MSVQTTLDNRSAEIVRSALSAAQAGRIGAACDIGKRGLAEGGDGPTLHALVGALLCGAGDYETAIPHLEAAHHARPADPMIGRNLATALTGCERYAEVGRVLNEEIMATDTSGTVLRLRGFAAQMSGDFPTAIADFERVLATHVDDWETWNNLGNAKLDSGDPKGAVQALRRAAQLNPAAAPIRLNLARALRDSGDLTAAETELRAMTLDFPLDNTPVVDLYHVLRTAGHEEEAGEVIAGASQRDPENVDLLLELGSQQRRTLNFAKAEGTYRRVLNLEPANGKAFLGLVEVLEHHRPSDLQDLAVQAEKAVDSDRLNLIKAFAARRTKDYEQGLAALSTVPHDLEPAIRWHLAGQMNDALGRYDEAFDAFSRMNETNAADESEPLRRAAEVRDALRGQLESTTPEWREGWRASALTGARPAPVFLAGFPRSGTTLLDTMLMGHPNVEVMEEPPILRQLEVEFGGFDMLAELDDDAVGRAQERYFELAANHVPLSDGAMLVDKSPLYLQRVPQIIRLFPDARFILALRHPADAVLSCFISNFRLNSSMSNFLRLDTAAEFYDLTFAMWERARNVFRMPVQTVMYEQMIEDPEASLRPVIEELGLQWHPDIVDHEQTAKARGVITTASYAQVTEPLYRRAAGRWHHYRKHLDPILPTLRPWIEKFGYEL